MCNKIHSLLLSSAFTLLVSDWAFAEFVPVDDIISDPTSSILDPEFDIIDNHMVWQDVAGNMWMTKIDPLTGDIFPLDGKGSLLDSNLTSGLITGNGPEWGYSYGTPVIAYTKNLVGTMGLARARQDVDGAWMADRLIRPLERWRPEGTHPSHNGPMRIAYNYTSTSGDLVGWRDIEDDTTEGTIAGQMAQGGRWLEGTDTILTMVKDANNKVQVGMTDINDGVPHIVTRGDRNKLNAFGWWAPEFDEPVFSVMLDARKVAIYRQADTNLWTLYYVINLPTPNPYVSSPEAFTVNGKSYIVVVAAEDLGTGEFKFQPVGPSEIWIAGIDPDNPFFRRVDDPLTSAQRSEPEMYYTADGPVVYYTEKDEITGIKLLRRAETGLGPDFGYDSPGYGGSWATVFRDNKNCNCTPFALAENYVEQTDWVLKPNLQALRQTLSTDDNLYAPILELGQSPAPQRFLAVDPVTGAEAWSLDTVDTGSNMLGTQSLTDEQGNVYLASQTHLNKFSGAGVKLWDVAIKGMPRSLQIAPDGNLVLFSWNGWIQVADTANGGIVFEKDLTPGRAYPASMSCLTSTPLSDCSYIDAPATDPGTSRIYQTLTTETGNGIIQAFDYVTSPAIDVVQVWSSAEFTGNVTSPVLAADYSRIYVQDEAGLLSAIDTATGATIWSFQLGFTGAREPAVTDHGFIMPGGKRSDSPALDYVGIVRDTGASAEWAFRTTAYAAESLPGSGRGNRFAVGARRLSDGALVLLVVHPTFGVISETPLGNTIPLPNELTGVTIRNDGWIFLGTVGKTINRAYQPVYDISPPAFK